MNTAELQVIYRPDEDGTGELIATVKSGAFAAKGSAWFGRNLESFVVSLRQRPPSKEDPPVVKGGFWNGQGGLDQCHLRISIKPYNSRGMLLVRVDVASGVWTTPDTDLQNSATIRFVTEYAALDRFATEFEQVLAAKRDVAVLEGNFR